MIISPISCHFFNIDTEDLHLSFKDIQVAAARALSVLCLVSYKAQTRLTENASFTGDVSEVSAVLCNV